MRVGVIDVGSNTVRLLVAEAESTGLERVAEERTCLHLGQDVELSGRIGDEKLTGAMAVARRYAEAARKLKVDEIEVIVTAPGRQAENGAELVAKLGRATGLAVRVLSTDEEGVLAYRGAVMMAGRLAESVAVCDVGGGSTEVLVGSADGGPAWCESLNVGSLRLTARYLTGDPPTKREIRDARGFVRDCLSPLTPPLPKIALATGGSARGLRKLVGRTLGEEELLAALKILRKRPSKRIAKTFSLDPLRSRTLAAGAICLLEVQRLLHVPFTVAKGGIREGAAVELAARRIAA